jgi:hypothetical protein
MCRERDAKIYWKFLEYYLEIIDDVASLFILHSAKSTIICKMKAA